MTNKIVTLGCKRCGHSWIPRKVETVVCPACKSPYWNTPKQSTATQQQG